MTASTDLLKHATVEMKVFYKFSVISGDLKTPNFINYLIKFEVISLYISIYFFLQIFMPSHSAASTELLKHARAKKRVSPKFQSSVVFGKLQHFMFAHKKWLYECLHFNIFFQYFSSDKCFTLKTIVSQIW